MGEVLPRLEAMIKIDGDYIKWEWGLMSSLTYTKVSLFYLFSSSRKIHFCIVVTSGAS